ncbi:MAG: YjbQ family protein [Desulfobulbaceae bacterium]|nr:YjbQ family protein [Desulfobulbaceae bacterium]
MVSGIFNVSTSSSRELINITELVSAELAMNTISSGLLYLFNPHTTAGLTINEGADPDVRTDIIKGLSHIVPDTLNYKHMEGNSPSHLMALLTGSSLTLQIENSRLVLGTWQKIFFCEYDGPRVRTVNWKIIAD